MKSVRELMSLEGRVALVTGGAGHLGSVICDTLAELGASVAVLDVDAGGCKRVAEDVRQRWNVETLPVPLDLVDEGLLRSLPELMHSHFGRLNILVNNAALVGSNSLPGWAVPFSKQRSDTWRLALEINLTVPFVLSQGCAELLKASGHSCIINIASTHGLVGPDMSLYGKTSLGNPSAYATSKGGLLQLTRWLSTVLAPEVRVNALTPGGIRRDQPTEFQNRYAARTPLGRMASEEDLKGAVAYLASDLSSYVTGHNLVVDGGWIAW